MRHLPCLTPHNPTRTDSFQDMLASVDVPNMQLRGFEKVMIPAGETTTVDIAIDVGELGVWDRKMRYVVEPGEFVVFAGGSSGDLRGNASFFVS